MIGRVGWVERSETHLRLFRIALPGWVSQSSTERLQPIWLLPHGVILAGAKAPDKVKVADRGGVKELSVALADGSKVKALLDAKNLTTHVEMKVGNQVLSADYADYKDFQDYGVMFPSRIVQKIDGHVAADLTVTEALANPHLIFPPPKELARKWTSRRPRITMRTSVQRVSFHAPQSSCVWLTWLRASWKLQH